MPIDYTTSADHGPATNQGKGGRPARGKRRSLDKSEVRAAAAGREIEILERAGLDPLLLDGKHHPCPRCGGVDRFRLIDAKAGAVRCNACATDIGDVLGSVAWAQSISFPEAVEFVAEALGFSGPARKVAPAAPPATPAPAGPPSASSTAAAPAVDPAADIAWREWDADFEKYAAAYCAAKPGVSVDAIRAAGGRPAIFTRRRKGGREERSPVFAFPMVGSSLDLSASTGWLLAVANGASFWPNGPKVLLSPGSRSGIVGAHAIEELKACRQHDSLARLHLWRCEGLNDLLALSGTIPDSERSRHVVITSGAGCENPKHLDAFIGVGGATVIGDCDRPGQKAAKAWAAALAKNGINARLWHPPYEIQEDGGRDVRDWLAEGHTFAELQREVAENGEAATAADAEPSSSEKPGRPPAQILTFGELAAQHRELRPPVIEGMIREGETANIVSNSKRGKSWLALGLALSVVNNERWLGRYAVRQGRVLLIDNELHPETIAYRVNKVASAMAVPMGNISDDFRIVNLRGDQRSLRELATTFESIEAGEYRLVIIDAKYRLMEPGTDENSNADETQFYNWVDAFASQTRSAFVLIHHASKGDQGGKSIIDIGAGAGAQSRAVDAHVTLRQHEQDDAAVMEAAVRSFPPLAPIALRWAPPLWIVADDQDPGRVRGRKAPRDDKQAADRVEDDALKALTAMRTMPLPESISQIRGAAKIPSLDRAKAAVGHLKAEGYVVDALKIAANGQRYDALDLTAKGRDEGVDEGAGGDAHGGTEQGSDRASETTQEEGLF